MQIELGKYYKMRNGKTVGPIIQSAFGKDSDWPFGLDGEIRTYNKYGVTIAWYAESPFDLVEEVYLEEGSLKEIGAKVGDVVEWCGNDMRENEFVSYEIDSVNGAYYHAKGSPACIMMMSSDHWRIISRASDNPKSPVRMVTRKEIVPGVYGGVEVVASSDDCHVWVCINEKNPMSANELRAAAKTLTDIADALDEA